MTVERLTLVLMYAWAMQRLHSALEERVMHIDLTNPSQYDRDCRWHAEMSKA